MKKILCFIFGVLFIRIASADTVNINWIVDDQTYDTTTCTVGGDIILPTAPTKRGHTFLGWTTYIPIEYLESTGTQYIDTRQNFMYGDEFFFDYMPITSYSSEDKGYGAGTSLPVNITGGGRRSGSSISMYNLNNNCVYSPALYYANTLGRRYTEHWTIKSGVLNSVLTDVLSGDTYSTSRNGIGDSYNSGNSVYLYCDHSSQYMYPSRTRIYGTWLKRSNGTYAFNMVPALDHDGVPCMYDTVTKTFFYNRGTGQFIAGPHK